MKETLVYIAIIIIGLVIVVIGNNHLNNSCIEKGGQIISNNGKLTDKCILPKGVK